MSEFVSGSPGQMEGRELEGWLRQMEWVVGLGLPTTPPIHCGLCSWPPSLT